MLDLENIKERYREMSDHELLKLARSPKDLREDVVPILKAELLKRGKKDEAASIDALPEESEYANLSLAELREIVQERLAAGEHLDSIKIDLRLQGIDVFEILKEENKYVDGIHNTITQLKEDGKTAQEIDTHLEKSYNIETGTAVKLRSDVKLKGKRNKNIGFVLILISVLLGLLVVLADTHHKLLKTSIICFISGCSLFALGTKQEKEEVTK